MKRIHALAITLLLAAPAALAQTAPDLFIFKPGTAIRADDMNANFQLLLKHITDALGVASLTTEDLVELADLVDQIQELAASGELDGTSLEFAWDGTKLGIKSDADEEFTYAELLGPAGAKGDAGPGLEYEWDGTRLGVRALGDDTFDYVQLVGPQGIKGDDGERGEAGAPGDVGATGAAGTDGAAGADGRNLEFDLDGTQLGVRLEGDDAFSYVELAGPQGEQGAVGATGEQGAQGVQGEQGTQGEQGEPGAKGDTGAAGARGLQGPAGADGVDGADGAAGAVGPAGPRGETGPAGPIGPAGTGGAHKQVIEADTTIGTEDAFYLVLGEHEITLPANPAPNQLLTFVGSHTGASINFNGNKYMFSDDPGQYTDLNTFAAGDLSRRFYLFWADSFWYWAAL